MDPSHFVTLFPLRLVIMREINGYALTMMEQRVGQICGIFQNFFFQAEVCAPLSASRLCQSAQFTLTVCFSFLYTHTFIFHLHISLPCPRFRFLSLSADFPLFLSPQPLSLILCLFASIFPDERKSKSNISAVWLVLTCSLTCSLPPLSKLPRSQCYESVK